MIQAQEHGSGKLNVHWKLDVYEGDIKCIPLSLRQQLHNILANLQYKLLGKLPEIYHRPKILNKQVDCLEGDNLVVTLGKEILLDRLFGLGGIAALTHMGVGTDSTAAAVGQNKLNPSVAGSVDFNAFDATPTRAALVVTCIATWATGDGNFAWNELGLANSATNDGTHLFSRLIIGPFTKTSAVSIIVTVTVTQA